MYELITLFFVVLHFKFYFLLKNFRIIIVGKGSDIADELKNINFDGKKIPMKEFDSYGNEK